MDEIKNELKKGAEKKMEQTQRAAVLSKPKTHEESTENIHNTEKLQESQENVVDKPDKSKLIPFTVKMFGKWDVSGVVISDNGLKNYLNIKPVMVPRTGGRWATKPFHKNDMSIVERLINKLMIPGHRGKRHKLTSGRCSASTNAIYLQVKKSFEIIEKRTKQNPMQVLVKAVENSSVIEEIAAYRLGGIIARQAVIVSPQRRMDIALKHLAQGIYKTSFKNKKSLANVIAEELIAAADNDTKSFAVSERNRIEREAEGAR